MQTGVGFPYEAVCVFLSCDAKTAALYGLELKKVNETKYMHKKVCKLAALGKHPASLFAGGISRLRPFKFA